MTNLLKILRPTDAWVRLALVPALAFIALAGDTQYLADFWHHLARGRAIVSYREADSYEKRLRTMARKELQP